MTLAPPRAGLVDADRVRDGEAVEDGDDARGLGADVDDEARRVALAVQRHDGRDADVRLVASEVVDEDSDDAFRDRLGLQHGDRQHDAACTCVEVAHEASQGPA